MQLPPAVIDTGRRAAAFVYESPWQTKAIMGGGLLVLAWYLGRGDKPPIPDTPENREWLARVLMTEQSFAKHPINYDEWGGIAWVAINRAARKGHGSIKKAVLTSGWFGATPPARMRSGKLLTSGRGPLAVEYVNRIFDGRETNPIGKRWHFVHPCGMPRCSKTEWVRRAKTKTRKCQWIWGCGTRWMPLWAVAKSAGGKAQFDPQRTGAAVFAEAEAEPEYGSTHDYRLAYDTEAARGLVGIRRG